MSKWLEASKRIGTRDKTDFKDKTPNSHKEREVLSVLSHLSAVPKPQTSKAGTADEILDYIRAAQSSCDIDSLLLEYADAVGAIEAQTDPLDAVRATHIRNLAEYIKGQF